MTEVPSSDKPGFVAEKPEHCFTCYRLIRPGQIYHLTIEFEVLCVDCALSEGVIRVRDDLAVEVRRDRLLIQRGQAEVEVFPGEIRHLVNALVVLTENEQLFELCIKPSSQGGGGSCREAMIPRHDEVLGWMRVYGQHRS